MEAVTAVDRGFHRVNLADCLKAGINVTKPTPVLKQWAIVSDG